MKINCLESKEWEEAKRRVHLTHQEKLDTFDNLKAFLQTEIEKLVEDVQRAMCEYVFKRIMIELKLPAMDVSGIFDEWKKENEN